MISFVRTFRPRESQAPTITTVTNVTLTSSHNQTRLCERPSEDEPPRCRDADVKVVLDRRRRRTRKVTINIASRQCEFTHQASLPACKIQRCKQQRF